MKKLFYTPFTEEVEDFLFNHINKQIRTNPNFKCLHLTPTMFLFRKRSRKFKYDFLKLASKQGNITLEYHQHITINQFDRWARDFVYKMHQEKPLSKSESYVLVKRAIERIYPNRKDWDSVTGRLLDLFLYLNSTDLSLGEIEKLSSFRDWQEILPVYQEYLKQLEEMHLEDYSQVLSRLIDTSLNLEDYDEVFFDGPFLFFEPVHERLIKRMENLGKTIFFFVPFNNDIEYINPAYNVIRKVYSHYVPESEWERIGWLQHGDSTFLEKLPAVIFTDQTTQYYGSSFQIQSYLTPEHELRVIIEQIANAIRNNILNRKEVLLVTPNPMKLRPLVRELSEQAGLDVEIPERPLLGLTSGEFIQLIYKIKVDDRKFEQSSFIDPSIFKKILQSNWFRGGFDSLKAFERVEEAFFNHLNTIEQWQEQIIHLIQVKKLLEEEPLFYHPLRTVQTDELNLWLSIIKEIMNIQNKVFHSEPCSIQQHAETLKNALVDVAQRYEVLNHHDVKETLDRVIDVVNGIQSQNRIPIRTEEFATVLHQLFIEQEEENDLEKEDWVSRQPVLVTGPENIAYLRYKQIYILQFTQENFPFLERPHWPLTMDVFWKLITKTTRFSLTSQVDLERLLADREKYYFYLTLLTPSTMLNISFPRSKEGIKVFPSHYLYDLAKVFGLEETNQLEDSSVDRQEDIIQILKRENILQEVDYIKQSYTWAGHQMSFNYQATPDLDYDLHELAIYKLCPKRYYFAKNEQDYHVYSTSFQLSRYIAAEIYKLAALDLFKAHKNKKFSEVLEHTPNKVKLMKEIPKYVRHAFVKINDLFPVEKQILENAEYYARLFLESLIDRIFDRKWFNQWMSQGTAHVSMEFDLPNRTVEITVNTKENSYSVNSVRELSVFYWNKEVTHSISHISHFLNISSYELIDYEEKETFAQWYWRLNREIFYEDVQEKVKSELAQILEGIEKRDFPKKTGNHCQFCPFQMICEEVELGKVAPIGMERKR